MKTYASHTPIGAEIASTHSVDAANSATTRLTRAIAGALEAISRRRSQRRMREQLAAMDTAMLIDIGIENDEIMRIRACEPFTPRRWQQQLDERRLEPRR